jgi:hypothetical protein
MEDQVQEFKAIAFLNMLAEIARRRGEEVEVEQEYKPSLGERRMRISFNEPQNTDVYRVKAGAANLINYLEAKKNDFASENYDLSEASFSKVSEDFFREIRLAQDEVEKSTYFVIKALTNEVLN